MGWDVATRSILGWVGERVGEWKGSGDGSRPARPIPRSACRLPRRSCPRSRSRPRSDLDLISCPRSDLDQDLDPHHPASSPSFSLSLPASLSLPPSLPASLSLSLPLTTHAHAQAHAYVHTHARTCAAPREGLLTFAPPRAAPPPRAGGRSWCGRRAGSGRRGTWRGCWRTSARCRPRRGRGTARRGWRPSSTRCRRSASPSRSGPPCCAPRPRVTARLPGKREE